MGQEGDWQSMRLGNKRWSGICSYWVPAREIASLKRNGMIERRQPRHSFEYLDVSSPRSSNP
jgi:hypothetical protein